MRSLLLLAVTALLSTALAAPAAAHDDGAAVHVDTNDLWSCVGPWGKTYHKHVGPVAITTYVCTPPGGTHGVLA